MSSSLTRSELIAIVTTLLEAPPATEEEVERLIRNFSANVPHPEASDLIYWPEHAFGPGADPTPEEIVDRALSYRAIEL